MTDDPAPSGRYATTAAAMERVLGDPMTESAGALSFRAAMERDEEERFPSDALEALAPAGISALHVPRAEGGRFESFEDLLAVARAVSRRDPSAALAAGMQVWSQLAWMAGSAPQRAAVRDAVLGGGALCFAASEPEHGADLLACETRAARDPDGFALHGTKWPIGGVAAARMALVLARTGESGARGLSWFLVERGAHDASMPAGMLLLPKQRTLGLRAAMIGGLSFDGLRLPASAMVGAEGAGLELTPKTFQITRPLAASLSLGLADSALRLASTFALGRRLYGTTASALPAVRSALAGAFADLLAAEALSLSTVRGAHVAPAELGVTSAATKVVVPMLGERVLREATEVLGARHYLRDTFHHGMFQKLLRDHGALPLFDGSTTVCLHALGGLLPALARPMRTDDAPARRARLAQRFDLRRAVPGFDHASLTLAARGEDDVVRGLTDLAARWADGGTPATLAPATAARLVELLGSVARAGAGLVETIRGRMAATSLSGRSTALLHFARRYAMLHAAAACAHLLDHAAGLDAFLQQGDWLVLALCRLVPGAASLELPLDEVAGADAVDRVASELFARTTTPRLFSVAPVAVAGI